MREKTFKGDSRENAPLPNPVLEPGPSASSRAIFEATQKSYSLFNDILQKKLTDKAYLVLKLKVKQIDLGLKFGGELINGHSPIEALKNLAAEELFDLVLSCALGEAAIPFAACELIGVAVDNLCGENLKEINEYFSTSLLTEEECKKLGKKYTSNESVSMEYICSEYGDDMPFSYDATFPMIFIKIHEVMDASRKWFRDSLLGNGEDVSEYLSKPRKSLEGMCARFDDFIEEPTGDDDKSSVVGVAKTKENPPRAGVSIREKKDKPSAGASSKAQSNDGRKSEKEFSNLPRTSNGDGGPPFVGTSNGSTPPDNDYEPHDTMEGDRADPQPNDQQAEDDSESKSNKVVIKLLSLANVVTQQIHNFQLAKYNAEQFKECKRQLADQVNRELNLREFRVTLEEHYNSIQPMSTLRNQIFRELRGGVLKTIRTTARRLRDIENHINVIDERIGLREDRQEDIKKLTDRQISLARIFLAKLRRGHFRAGLAVIQGALATIATCDPEPISRLTIMLLSSGLGISNLLHQQKMERRARRVQRRLQTTQDLITFYDAMRQAYCQDIQNYEFLKRDLKWQKEEIIMSTRKSDEIINYLDGEIEELSKKLKETREKRDNVAEEIKKLEARKTELEENKSHQKKESKKNGIQQEIDEIDAKLVEKNKEKTDCDEDNEDSIEGVKNYCQDIEDVKRMRAIIDTNVDLRNFQEGIWPWMSEEKAEAIRGKRGEHRLLMQGVDEYHYALSRSWEPAFNTLDGAEYFLSAWNTFSHNFRGRTLDQYEKIGAANRQKLTTMKLWAQTLYSLDHLAPGLFYAMNSFKKGKDLKKEDRLKFLKDLLDKLKQLKEKAPEMKEKIDGFIKNIEVLIHIKAGPAVWLTTMVIGTQTALSLYVVPLLCVTGAALTLINYYAEKNNPPQKDPLSYLFQNQKHLLIAMEGFSNTLKLIMPTLLKIDSNIEKLIEKIDRTEALRYSRELSNNIISMQEAFSKYTYLFQAFLLPKFQKKKEVEVFVKKQMLWVKDAVEKQEQGYKLAKEVSGKSLCIAESPWDYMQYLAEEIGQGKKEIPSYWTYSTILQIATRFLYKLDERERKMFFAGVDVEGSERKSTLPGLIMSPESIACNLKEIIQPGVTLFEFITLLRSQNDWLENAVKKCQEALREYAFQLQKAHDTHERKVKTDTQAGKEKAEAEKAQKIFERLEERKSDFGIVGTDKFKLNRILTEPYWAHGYAISSWGEYLKLSSTALLMLSLSPYIIPLQVVIDLTNTTKIVEKTLMTLMRKKPHPPRRERDVWQRLKQMGGAANFLFGEHLNRSTTLQSIIANDYAPLLLVRKKILGWENIDEIHLYSMEVNGEIGLSAYPSHLKQEYCFFEAHYSPEKHAIFVCGKPVDIKKIPLVQKPPQITSFIYKPAVRGPFGTGSPEHTSVINDYIVPENNPYDRTVKSMINDYIELLEAILQSKKDEEKKTSLPVNKKIGATEIKDYAVVWHRKTEEETEMLPLLFPADYLKQFKSQPEIQMLYEFEKVGKGFVRFEYEFKKFKDTYILLLHFFLEGLPSNEHIGSQILAIADFDELTVESFLPGQEESGFKYTEFMLTAMYGSAEACVGLPAMGSIDLTGKGHYCPVIREFTGLYNILSRNPPRNFSYHHDHYSDSAKEALDLFVSEDSSIEDAHEHKDLQDFFPTDYLPFPGEGYDNILITYKKEIALTYNDIASNVLNHDLLRNAVFKKYETLLSLLRLMSGLDYHNAVEQIEEYFNFIHPYWLDALKDQLPVTGYIQFIESQLVTGVQCYVDSIRQLLIGRPNTLYKSIFWQLSEIATLLQQINPAQSLLKEEKLREVVDEDPTREYLLLRDSLVEQLTKEPLFSWKPGDDSRDLLFQEFKEMSTIDISQRILLKRNENKRSIQANLKKRFNYINNCSLIVIGIDNEKELEEWKNKRQEEIEKQIYLVYKENDKQWSLYVYNENNEFTLYVSDFSKVSDKNLHVIRGILAKGTDADIDDKKGGVVLHHAQAYLCQCQMEHPEIKLLLSGQRASMEHFNSLRFSLKKLFKQDESSKIGYHIFSFLDKPAQGALACASRDTLAFVESAQTFFQTKKANDTGKTTADDKESMETEEVVVIPK